MTRLLLASVRSSALYCCTAGQKLKQANTLACLRSYAHQLLFLLQSHYAAAVAAVAAAVV
jgi:hypothetical protein